MAPKPEIVEESQPGASRSRAALPEREMAEIVTDDTTADGGRGSRQPSAEDAVAAARKAAEDANRRASESDAARVAAENRARNVEAGARRGALTERQQAVKSKLEAAKGQRDSAKAQIRAARENNDFDGELAAQDALATAAAAEGRYQQELDYLDSQTRTAGDGRSDGGRTDGGRQQGQYDEGADDTPPLERAWVQNHQLFATDQKYRAAVIAAATEAVNLGAMRGSQAYIDHIERAMNDRFGEGHGRPETHGRSAGGRRTNGNGQDRDDEPGSRRRPLSMAMPRSGADGGNGGMEEIGGAGARRMDTEFGPVVVERGPEGAPRIRMPTRLRAMWEDAASWMKHVDGSPYTLAEYALEQVQADEESRAGRNNGLTYESDQVYR